jgi:hypothetical protein
LRPVSQGIELHRDAIRTYLARAGSLPDSAWITPRAPGKWSPAELTQHLILTYEALVAELSGGPGIRVRVKGWRLLTLRLFVMPRFLKHGIVPPGVRAPKETAPAAGDPDRGAGLARLQEASRTFEDLARGGEGRRGSTVTHPFFGRLSLAQGVRFAEVHVRHHTGQLPS